MSELMIWWYQRLADLMIWVSELSGKLFPDNSTVQVIFLVITAVLVMGIFTRLLQQMQGRWPHWIYMVTGALPLWIGLYAAILRLEGKDLFAESAVYSSIPVLLILFLVLIFLAVNIFLDKAAGLQIATIWLGEFIFCCVIVQLWQYVKGSHTFSLDTVLPISSISTFLRPFLEGTGFGIQAFWLLSVVIFIIFGMIAVYMICYIMKSKSEGWKQAVYAQIIIAAVYLLYACTGSKDAVTNNVLLILLALYIAGNLYYLIIFLGRILLKDKSGCIGVLFVGIAGLCVDEALLTAIDFVKSGGAKGIFNGGMWLINAIYTGTPFSRYPQDNQSIFMVLCRLLIAIAILVILQFVFYRIARSTIIDMLNTTLSYTWVKSAARMAICPIILYWMITAFASVFASWPKGSIEYIQTILQTCSIMGTGLCLVNLIQMLIIGKWKQAPAILAVLAISFATLLFVPFLMSLI